MATSDPTQLHIADASSRALPTGPGPRRLRTIRVRHLLATGRPLRALRRSAPQRTLSPLRREAAFPVRSTALYGISIGPQLAAGDWVLEIRTVPVSAPNHVIGSDLFAAGAMRRSGRASKEPPPEARRGRALRGRARGDARIRGRDLRLHPCATTRSRTCARIVRALAEIARCLKREGIAMIDTHRGTGPTRSADAFRAEHHGA